MERMFQHIYMLPLFISTVLSLKSFRRRWPAPYRLFSILLLFIFIIELFAYLWKFYFINFRNWPYSKSNLWLYNSFLIPQYLLYMAFYYQILRKTYIGQIIPVLAIAFTAFAVVNMLFWQSIHSIESYTLAMASSIVIVMVVTWFNKMLKEKEIINLSTHPATWISVGAFIFHSANIPFILSLNYLVNNNMSLALALFYIFLALNCIMYMSYIIAFLCQPPQPI